MQQSPSSPNMKQMEQMLQNAEQTFKKEIMQPYQEDEDIVQADDPKPWYAKHRQLYIKNKLRNIYNSIALRECENPYWQKKN